MIRIRFTDQATSLEGGSGWTHYRFLVQRLHRDVVNKLQAGSSFSRMILTWHDIHPPRVGSIEWIEIGVGSEYLYTGSDYI